MKATIRTQAFVCVDRESGQIVGRSNDPDAWENEIGNGANWRVQEALDGMTEEVHGKLDATTYAMLEDIKSSLGWSTDHALAMMTVHFHGWMTGKDAA